MNIKQGILLHTVFGFFCLSAKAVTYNLPTYKEAEVVQLATPVAEYGNIGITDIRQISVYTPSFNTKVQSAADHLPQNADETNFQICVSQDLFQKNIRTKGISFFKPANNFISYTGYEVRPIQTSEYTITTNNGIVYENPNVTGSVTAQNEKNIAIANVQLPVKKDRHSTTWKQNNRNTSAKDEAEQAGTPSKRKIIIDEDDDIPGQTPQLPVPNPNGLGDMPLVLLFIFVLTYITYRRHTKQETD